MNKAAIIDALSAYRIIRGSGVSEPLRAVDVQGIADAVLEAVGPTIEGPSFSETLAASLALRKPYVLDLSGLPPEKRQSVAAVGAELNAALELGAGVLDRFSAAVAAVKASAADRDRIRRAIADGFSNGNEQYDDADPAQQERFDMAADAVLALPRPR